MGALLILKLEGIKTFRGELQLALSSQVTSAKPMAPKDGKNRISLMSPNRPLDNILVILISDRGNTLQTER